MNFTKTTSYSLSILSYMAQNEAETMSAEYLHEKLGIPYQYLRQLMTSLSESGFIESTRGRKGGFTFRKSINKIFLADIIEASEGLESYNKCFLGLQDCPFDNQCSMHEVWQGTRENILKILKETSLAHLLKKN
jgi:Rrf2 family protein